MILHTPVSVQNYVSRSTNNTSLQILNTFYCKKDLTFFNVFWDAEFEYAIRKIPSTLPICFLIKLVFKLPNYIGKSLSFFNNFSYISKSWKYFNGRFGLIENYRRNNLHIIRNFVNQCNRHTVRMNWKLTQKYY